jgi:hypothetical protein
MHAVRRLCTGGIFLQEGRLVERGDLEPIVRRYEGSFQVSAKEARQGDLYQSPQLAVRQVEIRHPESQLPVARSGEPLEITMHLDIRQPCTLQAAAVTIYDLAGTKLVNVDSLRKGEPIRLTRPGLANLRFFLPQFPLQEGRYEIGLWAKDTSGTTKMYLRNVHLLEVQEPPRHAGELRPDQDGCVRCDFDLSCTSPAA